MDRDESRPPGDGPSEKKLTPEAKRALAEAEARRREAGQDGAPPKEIGGAKGEEPTRFGDWERGGRAVDF